MVSSDANVAFREMLTRPGSQEQIIGSLANFATERVRWAVFNALHDDKSDEKNAPLREALAQILHWALHIAQSITQFNNASENAVREIALVELYHRPFIMFDTYDDSHGLMLDGSWMRYERPVPPPPTLDHFGELAGAKTTEEGDAAGSPGLSDAGRALRRNADLYMALLEWLVSSRERNKLKVRDCFLHICSLALNMSANAVLVLWEV